MCRRIATHPDGCNELQPQLHFRSWIFCIHVKNDTNAGNPSTMTRLIFSILSLLLFILALWFLVTDLLNTDESSRLLGEVWFENSKGSLQVSEAIISRYIDPCGLIMALGCSTFLWHPVISSMLVWPAGLFFILLSGVIFGIGRLFPARNSPRKRAASLKREGR